MNDLATRQAIASSLANFATKPLAGAATALFESLGYSSQKRITLTGRRPVLEIGEDSRLKRSWSAEWGSNSTQLTTKEAYM